MKPRNICIILMLKSIDYSSVLSYVSGRLNHLIKKIFTLNKDLLTSCKRAQNIKKIDCIHAVRGYTWENCASIFLKNIYVNKK